MNFGEKLQNLVLSSVVILTFCSLCSIIPTEMSNQISTLFFGCFTVDTAVNRHRDDGGGDGAFYSAYGLFCTSYTSFYDVCNGL